MSSPLIKKTAVWKGHTIVYAVAISHDGSLLAAAHADSSVTLRDTVAIASTPAVTRAKFDSHAGAVRSLVFSSDDSLLATASDDATVKLWQMPSGVVTVTLTGHSNSVNAVAFLSGNKFLVSGSRDKTVIVWEVASGKNVAVLTKHTGAVYAVASACDGRMIASSGADKSIKLWSSTTFELLNTFSCSTEVNCLAFSPTQSSVLASGEGSGEVVLWDVLSGTMAKTQKNHAMDVISVAFSRDGRTLASGSLDGTAKLWDVPGGALRQTLADHGGGLNSVTFSNGDVLATASDDKSVLLWEFVGGIAHVAAHGAVFTPQPHQQLADPNAHKALADRVAQHEAELTAAKETARREVSKLQEQLVAAQKAVNELQQEKEAAVRSLANSQQEVIAARQQAATSERELNQQLTVARSEKSGLQRSHEAALAVKDQENQKLQDQVAQLLLQVVQLEAANASPILPNEPYRFDPAKLATLQRAMANIVVEGQIAPRALHVDVTPLPPHITELWDRGGACGSPVRGFAIKRFDALTFDSSDMLIQAGKVAAAFLLQGRKTKLEEINRTFTGTKKTVLDVMKKLFVTTPRHNPNVFYTFHGCRAEVVKAVFAGSFQALHRNDGGFFGQGVYTTPNVEYACRYATKELSGTLDAATGWPSPADAAAPPQGCYAVLCCASIVSMVYPVTHDEDYETGQQFSIFYAPPRHPSKALKPCCDAHFVPVAKGSGFQACPPNFADYYELVQNRNELVIPMGVLWVQRVQ